MGTDGRGLKISVLGPVRATVDDEPIRLPSVAQRRLVAYLALRAPKSTRAERIADELDISLSSLRTTIGRVRESLGGGSIVTVDSGYRLEAEVDLREVRGSTARAFAGLDLDLVGDTLDRWRGEPFEEFRHELWAAHELVHLDELRDSLVELQAELLVASGRSHEAVGVLMTLVDRTPLRESGHVSLMDALTAVGRRAEALRHASAYRKMLRDEVGLVPSDAFVETEARLADDTGSAPTTPRHPLATRPPTRGDPVFVGRERELDTMRSAFDASTSGRAQLVNVTGPAGIGKSYVCKTFVRSLAVDHAATVSASCDETAPSPLGPVVQLLGQLFHLLPETDRRQHLSSTAGELQRLIPALRDRRHRDDATASDPSTERLRMLDAIVDLVGRVASRRPVVLLVDDVHWATPQTLDVLTHLGHRGAQLPMLLLTTARHAETLLDDDRRRSIAELHRVMTTHTVDLTNFDRDEMTELAKRVTGDHPDEGAITHLLELTAGNPLFAAQLIEHLVTQRRSVDREVVRDELVVPSALRELIWLRARSLGEPVAAVLQMAAAIGSTFDTDVLARLLRQDDDAVERAIDLAAAAGLVNSLGIRRVEFVHDLVRRALSDECGVVARRRRHAEIARVIQECRHDLSDRDIQSVAHHALESGDPTEIIRWSVAAAEVALAQRAPGPAADWLSTAVGAASDDPSMTTRGRSELLVRLGDAQRRAGRREARETLLAAGRSALDCEADDLVVEAALLNQRGLQLIDQVDEERVRSLEAALDVVDPSDAINRAQLLALAAQEAMHVNGDTQRAMLVDESLSLLEQRTDDDAIARAAPALLNAMAGPGTVLRRHELAERALRAARHIDDNALRFRVNFSSLHVAIEAGDLGLKQRTMREMTRISTMLNEPMLHWLQLAPRAFDAVMSGRLAEARSLAEEVLELGQALGQPDARAVHSGVLFGTRSYGGGLDEVLPLARRMVELHPHNVTGHTTLGVISSILGDRTTAAEVLAAGLDQRFEHVPRDFQWAIRMVGYAVIAGELRDREAARSLYDQLEPHAEFNAFGGLSSQGNIGCYVGDLANVLGRYDEAEQRLLRSIEVHRAFRWRYHEGTALVMLADARRRRLRGAIDASVTGPLERAAAIADEHGFVGLDMKIDRYRTAWHQRVEPAGRAVP